MRRHTVGIAHPQDETAATPTDAAHYFTQHHHHQPAVAGQFLHPTMFAPGGAAAHGLPHIFMPQDLSVHSASEDEASPTSYLSVIADSHLLRPPQIAGMIVDVHCVPKKGSHLMFDNNFGKCGPIFIILSPADS